MKFTFFPSLTLAMTLVLSSNELTTVNAALRGATDDSEQQLAGHRILSEEVSATFFVSEVEMEGHDLPATNGDERRLRKLPGNSDRKLNIGLADGTFYEVKNAAGTGWAEGLVSGESTVGLPPGVIIRSDGTVDMGGKDPNPKSNAGGNGVGGPFHRDLESTEEQKRNLAQLQRNLATTGDKSILAVRIYVDDAQYGYTADFLSNEVFGNGVDNINLKTQYEACSYNKLRINKATDRPNFDAADCSDPVCTGISNGVVTVRVAATASQGDSTIRNLVTSKLNAMFNVSNPNQLANHVMYCMPPGAMGGIAYAYINSWNSVYSNQWCNYPSGQMHELGHNFGYAHANEGGTYKDQTGMMGYSYSSDEGPVMCFNGAKSWQTGWYTDKSIVINPTATDGSECYEGDLHGVATYNAAGATTVLVKIDDPQGSTSHFVNFNARTGINSGTQEAGNQVTVTRTSSGEGNSYAESELVAKLGAGSWTATIRGVSMKVVVNSVSGSTSANVLIAPSSYSSCTVGTQSPTDSPTKQPTNAPTLPQPTMSPTTGKPTTSPTPSPTRSPVTSVTKYMCANKAKSQAEICLDGEVSLNVCPVNSDNTGCGNGNKYCQSAVCPGTSGPNPPSPTPPSPTPPSPTPPTTCGVSGVSCANKWDCCSQNCARVGGSKQCVGN